VREGTGAGKVYSDGTGCLEFTGNDHNLVLVVQDLATLPVCTQQSGTENGLNKKEGC